MPGWLLAAGPTPQRLGALPDARFPTLVDAFRDVSPTLPAKRLAVRFDAPPGRAAGLGGVVADDALRDGFCAGLAVVLVALARGDAAACRVVEAVAVLANPADRAILDRLVARCGAPPLP